MRGARIRLSLAWALVGLAGINAVLQVNRMVRAVGLAQTDFSVFHRTARWLAAGGGPDIYRRLDEPTGWYHCIPPLGTVLVLPLAPLPAPVAAIIWGAFNLGVVGLMAWALRQVLRRLDRHGPLFAGTYPWALLVLLVLSSGALQVGQYTVLIVACWVLYLVVSAHGRPFGAALLLGVPATVKFYPALIWAVPVALRRWREVAWLPVVSALMFTLVPLAVYGPRAWELTVGYFQGNVSGEVKRLDRFYDLGAPSTEGLDLILLRYLTHDESFHSAYPWWPHADLPPRVVHALAHVLRLVILAVSVTVAWRWGARHQDTPRLSALMLLALWTATLYLILPEMKSRYALYLFPAFLPLIAAAAGALRSGSKWRGVGLTALVVLCTGALIQLTPKPWRMCGPGLAATLLVWLSVLLLMRADELRSGED